MNEIRLGMDLMAYADKEISSGSIVEAAVSHIRATECYSRVRRHEAEFDDDLVFQMSRLGNALNEIAVRLSERRLRHRPPQYTPAGVTCGIHDRGKCDEL